MQPEREQLRQHYLEAMGVRSWFARVAPELGRTVDWPPVPEEPSAGGEPSARQEPSAHGEPAAGGMPSANTPQEPEPGRLQDAMAAVNAAATEAVAGRSGTEDPAADAAVTMPEPETESEAVKSGQGVEFKQRWWARDGWLIVDTRPPGMPAGQQRGADRLLAALAQTVCGERQPTVAHNIDWPLFVNRSIKHDVEEARFYLQQKWQSAEREGKIRYLLMLGDSTPELLNCEPPDGFAADMGGWQAGDLACFVGPALSELMHLPAQKRKFWHSLQPWLDNLP